MKKFSISLAIREKKIKTMLRFYLTPVGTSIFKIKTTNVGEDVGKKEPSYTAAGNVN
jgi:hypothetical protein